MRIGLVEFLLILAIASLTVGPQVALFVDRWMRRANRASAQAARRRAEYAAQAAAERDALLKRFRTASTVFGVCILLALVYALVLRPIDTPPQRYKAPETRQDTGAAQTALSTDSKDSWDLGEYQGVDCIREQDGLVYAAAYNGAALKKRTSDLVRTDGGHYAAILSVDGDLWLTVVTTSGGALCRAVHDNWGAAVEQVVTQIDGAPLGAISAVEVGPDGKVYFAVVGDEPVDNGLESALRTELLAHTGTGWVYVYDPADRSGGRQRLRERRRQPAGLPRCAGAGRRRCAVHQLPLEPQRLAGTECRQHLPARGGPACRPEPAAEAVPHDGGCALRRCGGPGHRGVEAHHHRPGDEQLRGGVPGGQQSVFWCSGLCTPAAGKSIKGVF